MLKAKLSQDKKYINFDLEGVYHIATKKTASELKENKDAKVVEAKSKQYDAEEPLLRENESRATNTTKNTESDDDFPF